MSKPCSSSLNQGAPPAAAQELFRLLTAHWDPQIVRVFCKLRLADHLTEPKTYSQLAAECSLPPDMLHRFLRAAETVGVCKRAEGGTYELTEMGEYCKSDHPYSGRGAILCETGPALYLPWLQLEDVLKTGKSSVPLALGADNFYDYLQDNPEELENFSAAMNFRTKCGMGPILESLSFDQVQKLIDIGGGSGDLVKSLLQKYTEMTGVIADLPHVVDGNPPIPADLQSRCTSVGIDMFHNLEAVKGADGYVMKHILHNWPDEACVKVLENIKNVMAPGGRIFTIDSGPVSEDGSPHTSNLMDINMAVLCGTRERTISEYKKLGLKAGLKLVDNEVLQCSLCILTFAALEV